MYQKEEFKKLMRQYVSGEISTDGKTRLLEMIDDPQYAKNLDAVLRKNYSKIELVTPDADSTSRFITSLKEKIHSAAVEEEATSTIPFYHWKKIFVAASVVLVLGVGLYKYVQKTELPAVVTVEKNNITPGSTGAILTLADGSQIVLDSVVNGILANQNRTVVSKKDGALVYTGDKNSTAVINRMTTPRGRQYQLVLADGTKVWLNASSSITFPTTFIQDQRKVAITGEAYFEVAKDKKHPFVVTANGSEVTVLGTHFNINSYRDEKSIKTTLLEGSVLVSKKNQKVLLQPGEQAELSRAGVLQVNKLENFDDVMAWRNGNFHFSNASLENVMNQLSRWYDVDVVFEKGLITRNFDGEISRDLNLNDVLKILETNNIHFKIEGKTLRVLP
ncbi:MAG: FecR family protein [Flavobacterium sp.]